MDEQKFADVLRKSADALWDRIFAQAEFVSTEIVQSEVEEWLTLRNFERDVREHGIHYAADVLRGFG